MEKIRFEIKKEDTEEFCFYLQERENSKETYNSRIPDVLLFVTIKGEVLIAPPFPDYIH